MCEGAHYFYAYGKSVGSAENTKAPPALVDTLALGDGDTFTLTLQDKYPLKLGEGAHDVEQQLRHRRRLSRERKALLQKLNADSLPGEIPNQTAQIFKVTGQAVHRMDHHGVAVPDIGDELRQLRAVSILARGVVGEVRVVCRRADDRSSGRVC